MIIKPKITPNVAIFLPYEKTTELCLPLSLYRKFLFQISITMVHIPCPLNSRSVFTYAFALFVIFSLSSKHVSPSPGILYLHGWYSYSECWFHFREQFYLHCLLKPHKIQQFSPTVTSPMSTDSFTIFADDPIFRR